MMQLISLLSILQCFVREVAPLLDLRELEDAKYGLEILDTPMAVRQDVGNAMDVVSKYGQAYRCSLPVFEAPQPTSREENKQEQETGSSQERSTSDVIKELLSPLKGVCLTKTKGWWTYEFCYGKDIKQYHLEANGAHGDVVYLGYYSSEETWTQDKEKEMKKKKFAPRFHSQTYLNGSVCDITGKPRKAQVKFLCENGIGDYIARIDELLTCQYVVYIHTTHICHHPFFRQAQQTKAQPIRCSPLLGDEEYELYVKRLEEERKLKLEETNQRQKELLEESLAQQSNLPFDSGYTRLDASDDLEPLYEAGDEDTEAQQHETDYDSKKHTAETPDKEDARNSGATGDFLSKLFSTGNEEEEEDGDEDADGQLRMDKVVKKVMRLLSELKDDEPDKKTDKERERNDMGRIDNEAKDERTDGYQTDSSHDRHKWKVRVRKLAQKDADREAVQEEDETDGKFSKMLEEAKQEIEKRIKKGLEEAGVKTEGEVQVKFITTNGDNSFSTAAGGMQPLSEDETDELQRLFGNRVGAEREEQRQRRLESSYEKVWNEKQTSRETLSEGSDDEDNKEE